MSLSDFFKRISSFVTGDSPKAPSIKDDPRFNSVVHQGLLLGAYGDAYGVPIRYFATNEMDRITWDARFVSGDVQLTVLTSLAVCSILDEVFYQQAGGDSVYEMLANMERHNEFGRPVVQDFFLDEYFQWLRMHREDVPFWAAQSLPKCKSYPKGYESLKNEFLMQSSRMPNASIMSALASHPRNGSIKNGKLSDPSPVMRVLPIGIALGKLAEAGKLTQYQARCLAFQWGWHSAACTNSHPDSLMSSALATVFFADLTLSKPDSCSQASDLLWDVVTWLGKEDWHRADWRFSGSYTDMSIQRAFSYIRSFDSSSYSPASLGTGSSATSALSMALLCSLTTSSKIKAIQRAALHDGNSISTACLTGQLKALIEQNKPLPLSHTEFSKLEGKPVLMKIADQLQASIDRVCQNESTYSAGGADVSSSLVSPASSSSQRNDRRYLDDDTAMFMTGAAVESKWGESSWCDSKREATTPSTFHSLASCDSGSSNSSYSDSASSDSGGGGGSSD